MDPLRDDDESWPVESSTDLHRDGWVVALRADWVRRPGAPEEPAFRRLVLEHPGAVVVLALDDDERVLCVRQYRHPARTRFLELPAGLCDVDGEDLLEVGARELREEAGIAAAHWHPLLSTYPSPGISAERHHFFLARDLRPVDRGIVPEHEEADLEVLWIPVDELVQAILAGTVTDGPVVQAVLAYDVLRSRTSIG